MSAMRPRETNSSEYSPTRHNKTIISASQVLEEVREIERKKTLITKTPVKEQLDEDAVAKETRSKASPIKQKELKEIGTEYDPPEVEQDIILNSSISDVP
jgi:hypothetical protein